MKEQLNLNKEHELYAIEVVSNSLIVSPLVSKEENIKMFNNWLEEIYGSKH